MAIYLILLVVVIVAVMLLGRRSFASRRSIERHQRTMDLLGSVTERSLGRTVSTEEPTTPLAVSSEPTVVLPASPMTSARTEPSIRPPLVGSFSDDQPTVGLSAAVPGVQKPVEAAHVPVVPPSQYGAPRSRGGATVMVRRLAGRPSHPLLVAASIVVLGAGIGIGIGEGLSHKGAPSIGALGSTTLAPSASNSSLPSNSTPTSTSTTTPASGGTPVLSSITPSAASAGDTLTINGASFQSSDGKIFAVFGSQAAPTQCPSEQQCLAVVPPGAHGTVVVRLETAGGKSNGLSFHYS